MIQDIVPEAVADKPPAQKWQQLAFEFPPLWEIGERARFRPSTNPAAFVNRDYVIVEETARSYILTQSGRINPDCEPRLEAREIDLRLPNKRGFTEVRP